MLAERAQERHIGGVAAAGDQHPAAAGDVVAGIKHVPAIPQKGLKPGGEIDRGFAHGNPRVAEVAGAVTGRDVEAAAERDRQMGIVAADTGAIGEGVQAQAISAVGSQ